MQPIETDYTPEFRRNRKRMTVAVIAVAIAVSAIFVGTGMESSGTVNVLWLQVNLSYQSGSNYFGPSVFYIQENVHTISSGSDHSFSVRLVNMGNSVHEITGINVETPGFSLISASPDIPVQVQPGHAVTIYFTVKVPNGDFAGNLAVGVTAS